MQRETLADLVAFAVVAEERSFTRAAARLDLSQSALSQIVRRLEDRLDVRLLTRTTRSVAPTEIGERVLITLRPVLDSLDSTIAEIAESRDRPVGTIRINSVEHAARTVLLPSLAPLMIEHSGIAIEIVTDYGLTDVVGEGFDAGVRLGDSLERDMIGMRISADIPMAIVGAPDYFRRHPPPEDPRDLTGHACIALRLNPSQTLNQWRMRRGEKRVRARVEGPLVLASIDLIREAAIAGVGLAWLPLDEVEEAIRQRRLRPVCAEWTEPLPGYHLYYPNRRHHSLAFRLMLDALRC